MGSKKGYSSATSLSALFSLMNCFTSSSFPFVLFLLLTLSMSCSPIIFPSSRATFLLPIRFIKNIDESVAVLRCFSKLSITSLFLALGPSFSFVMISSFDVFFSILLILMLVVSCPNIFFDRSDDFLLFFLSFFTKGLVVMAIVLLSILWSLIVDKNSLCTFPPFLFFFSSSFTSISSLFLCFLLLLLLFFGAKLSCRFFSFLLESSSSSVLSDKMSSFLSTHLRKSET
mmetsp:Transcript_7756/g.15578  ORF Transcript_7756/g.15578 Transcript_7756/m.15578 type:complete len:229 (-) Transcript_7756:1384-2070(-)